MPFTLGATGKTNLMSLIPPSIKALILDMDGVLWKDSTPIGDLPMIFNRIQALGLQVVLATNNATLSVDMYLSKLNQMGVNLQAWQIITSPQAAAFLLQQHLPSPCAVYVIGEKGLQDTLALSGYAHSDNASAAVVAGLDRTLTYEKLRAATLLIKRGALFIATNLDATLPTPQGPIPGAGAVIAALQTATAVLPLVAGKPHPTMYQMAFDRLRLAPDQTLAVGDRLETDIAGGLAAGCQTALVLTGISTAADAAVTPFKPHLVADSLSSLLGL